MRVSRRSLLVALAATIGVALAATAGIVTLAGGHGLGHIAPQQLGGVFHHGPKALVDRPQRELGVIGDPQEFAQKFVFRNQGDSPLELARGPSSCSCTATDLPEGPIPPGGQAVVGVRFNETTKHDILKAGPLAQSMTVLTNDPDRPRIVLQIAATVVLRVTAAPADLTLSLKTTDLSSEEKRSAETLIYSQTWDRFDLAAGRASQRGISWRIAPAAKKELAAVQGRSGYHVRITLPPDMPDGRFAATIDFPVKPPAAAERPCKVQVQLQGSIDGRLAIYGGKLDANQVLRLGVLEEGESVQENLVMKLCDERPALVIERIETEPAFLRARAAPCGGGAAKTGLYRITVEIPHAPPCNFADPHFALIRLKTNHPRLPVIEVKVDFAVVSREGRFGR